MFDGKVVMYVMDVGEAYRKLYPEITTALVLPAMEHQAGTLKYTMIAAQFSRINDTIVEHGLLE